DPVPANVAWPVRPERLRRQRDHRPGRRRPRQLPPAVRILRTRPDARARLRAGHGRTAAHGQLPDDRSDQVRLATPGGPHAHSRAGNHLMAEAFDYIVVGAGSAGCIVASRLTEEPAVRVLLVEAGGSDRTPIIAMPGALPFAYQSRRIGWGYQAGPEPHLGGKTIDEKAGKVIGGTSSINAMIYNRGNPMDFDGWASAGLPDWDYAHCLPYFRKMETFSDGPDDWRGGDGPLRI